MFPAARAAAAAFSKIKRESKKMTILEYLCKPCLAPLCAAGACGRAAQRLKPAGANKGAQLPKARLERRYEDFSQERVLRKSRVVDGRRQIFWQK
jgi:hypothetical protein